MFQARSSILMMMVLAMLSASVSQPVMATSNEGVIPSTFYCEEEGSCHDNGQEQRVWSFPDIRINMVCNYDFRQEDVTPNSYTFPDASLPTIQATWGSFLDAIVDLVPQVGGSDSATRVGPTGLFWMHGGEGRPGWEIPPCGTNRTQGVVNLAYLTVLLNETTADPDLYNFGLSLAQAGVYLNEEAIRNAIEEHVCNDLERIFVGVALQKWTEDDLQYFYPQPEEICPRVPADDSVWEDWWWLFLLVAVVAVALLAILLCVRYGTQSTKQTTTDTQPAQQVASPEKV